MALWTCDASLQQLLLCIVYGISILRMNLQTQWRHEVGMRMKIRVLQNCQKLGPISQALAEPGLAVINIDMHKMRNLASHQVGPVKLYPNKEGLRSLVEETKQKPAERGSQEKATDLHYEGTP